MPEDALYENLGEATEILRSISGQHISSFRGPRLKTSSATQKVLLDLGYTSDSSVASQRIDFLSSNLVNFGWIIAPRLPYHPGEDSPFRRGQLPLWVVPVSAIIMPFISSALYVFRMNFMKNMFKMLYREARRTGKPIVYLIHPFEFAPIEGTWVPNGLSTVQRIRTYGFVFRERLYEKDHQERLRMNRELFEYMNTFPDVHFRTVRDYVSNELKVL